MRKQPAAILLSILALALPVWFLPASFEAFLLPKTVLLATGALGALAICIALPQGGQRWGACSWGWAGLFCILTLSYAVSPWRPAGFEAYALAAGFALAGLAAGLILRPGGAETAAQAASLAAIAASLWALWQGPGAPSTLGNPDFLASYLAGCGPLLPALSVRSKGWRAWAWAAGGAFCFAALLASGSRGAWLAAALIWLPSFALAWRRAAGSGRRILSTLAVFCALLLIGNLIFKSQTSVFVRERAAAALRTDTKAFSGRKLMWKVAREMVRDRPLLGQGPGGYHYKYLEFQAREFAKSGAAPLYKYWTYTHSAHNAYLQLAADSGLLGFHALLIIIVLSAKGWLAKRSSSAPDDLLMRDAWAAAALALLVDGLLGLTLQLPASAFLLALALNAAPSSNAAPALIPHPSSLIPVFRWSLAALLLAAVVPLWRLQVSDILIGRALAAVQAREPARAEEALRKAIVAAPMHSKASFFLGNVLIMLGRPGEAVPPLLEALRR
ncbi:MAG: O-antigen ligase family protein, partial [Elusimicrobiota bacterium]